MKFEYVRVEYQILFAGRVLDLYGLEMAEFTEGGGSIALLELAEC